MRYSYNSAPAPRATFMALSTREIEPLPAKIEATGYGAKE